MNFTQYMMEFYGPNGVYSELNFNVRQIEIATQIYKGRLVTRGVEFCGDSVDREAVRDIVLSAREGVIQEFAKI